MDTSEPTFADLGRDIKRYGFVLGLSVALLFGLEVLSWVLPIDRYGVHPREPLGLIGVLAHPFLHGGLLHVIGNSVGLLLFGGLIVLKEEKDLYVTTAVAALVGGLGIWLFAPAGQNHIGASGIVFGLFGYLLSSGFFERRLLSAALSVLVLLAWGSMVFGVLPGQPGVSWQGHLFGFAGGILSAFVLARIRRKRAANRKSVRRSAGPPRRASARVGDSTPL